MSKTWKPLLVLTTTTASLAVLGAVTVPSESLMRRATTDAKQWVIEHRTALPSDLEAISTLPYLHRKAVIDSLSLEGRRRLLTEQLDAFLLPVDQLSAVQKRMRAGIGKQFTTAQSHFIEWSRDTLQVILGPRASLPQLTAFSRIVCAEAARVFDPRTQRLVFGTIGPEDPNYVAMAGKSRSVTRASMFPKVFAMGYQAAVKLGVAKATDCDCTSRFCDCETCNASPCVASAVHCGCFFADLCVSVCD